jgi:hypothetical protein
LQAAIQEHVLRVANISATVLEPDSTANHPAAALHVNPSNPKKIL